MAFFKRAPTILANAELERNIVKLTRFIAVTLLLMNMVCAQEQSESADVSVDFAKAGNLALVAIKNANGEPDKLVKSAVNNAEATAFNDAEIYVVKQIKFLSVAYPVRFSSYVANVKIALQTRSVEANANADNAKIALDKSDRCIEEWRIALHKLSAVTPKVCLSAPEKEK
jgi:hypothetical protein